MSNYQIDTETVSIFVSIFIENPYRRETKIDTEIDTVSVSIFSNLYEKQVKWTSKSIN